MNVFEVHAGMIDGYADYIRSFINIADGEIANTVEESLSERRPWLQLLLQFNSAYEIAGPVQNAITAGVAHPDVRHIFRGYSC